MHSAAYRWHVALTAAGGLYATIGAVATAVGLAMLLSGFELPASDALLLIIGLAVLALGVLELAAGWLLERALSSDAPRKRPYVQATSEALRGLLLGIVLPPVVGAAILPTWFAYTWMRKRGERKA